MRLSPAVRVIRAYGREDYEIERARSNVTALYELYMKASRVQALASPMIEAMAAIAIAGIVYYGGMQVFEGETTPGAFSSFIVAMIMAYKPIRAMAGLNTHLQEGLAAARRFFQILDTKPQVREADDAAPLALRGGQIVFEKVSFAYHPEAPAPA